MFCPMKMIGWLTVSIVIAFSTVLVHASCPLLQARGNNLSPSEVAELSSQLPDYHSPLFYSPKYTGSTWQKKSASDKLSQLWSELTSNKKSNGWYSSAHMAELFVEDMDTSFNTVGDDMPAQYASTLERAKLIHSVGAVAQMAFVPDATSKYTGVLQGCENMIGRVSLATKPADNMIVPGLSLKFLIDGHASANVFAMYSLLGQTSYNVFKNDLTNHAPNVAPSLMDSGQKALYDVFAKVSKYPVLLGLHPLSAFTENGSTVASPVFPFRLVFHPTTALHSMFPDAPQSGSEYFLDQLESVPIGKLYDVYAQESPTADVEYIGYLKMETAFTRSYFGDRDLFYQHTKFDSDLSRETSWQDGTDKIMAEQAAQTSSPYTYPNLPFS